MKSPFLYRFSTMRSALSVAQPRVRYHNFSCASTRGQSDRSAPCCDTAGAAITVPSPPPTPLPPPSKARAHLLSRAFAAYGQSQREKPYRTQFISSLIIFFLGDVSAQLIGADEYDPQRSLRALIISAGCSIPTYKWIVLLGNHFNYSSKALTLATKMLVNQALFTPINCLWFFGMHSLLAGNALAEAWEHIQRTLPPSVINSCKLWPAVVAINYTFIRPEFRGIFVGVISVTWQTYLSYVNRKFESKDTPAVTA